MRIQSAEALFVASDLMFASSEFSLPEALGTDSTAREFPTCFAGHLVKPRFSWRRQIDNMGSMVTTQKRGLQLSNEGSFLLLDAVAHSWHLREASR